eukprot:5656025-Lingulodinium_polyedra.AAC.1
MGWTWALWWMQRVRERVAARHGADPDQRIVDYRPTPNLSKVAFLIYVDNFLAIGHDREAVCALAREVVAGLRQAGLVVHEEFYGEDV